VFRLPLDLAIVPDSGAALRIERIELTQASQRFEIPADRAPKDVTLDPNAWVLMDPPKFVARMR